MNDDVLKKDQKSSFWSQNGSNSTQSFTRLHIMSPLVIAHSINIIIGFNLIFYFLLCYTESWLHQQPQNDTRLEGLDFRNKQSFTCRGEWEKMPKRRETSITSYKTLTTYNKFYYHLLFVKPVLVFFDFSSLQRWSGMFVRWV